ncbi:hypothetical protein GALMADRAFT_232806 [Galerina marginata CBS 339.88]|uniref:F-box domain-containing protein n=1 Tax=Galerina marginata (strain CBS 339.88) TaxID=685588 RepID=A0A067SDW1_GALM3|nr:hypothetical protein GALMADRAFT_232806 [Galerina marginata CBS 339.88]
MNTNANLNADIMEFDEIPDDVWISVFEHVPPAQLAVIMLICRRFRLLASRLLLRDIWWSQPYATRRNLAAWKGGYRGMEALPKRLTVGIPFDLGLVEEIGCHATPDLRLYDMIHSRITSFTGLVELVLNGTTISLYTYTVLAALPALRSFSVLNCTFSRLRAPGSITNTTYSLSLHNHHHQQQPAVPPFPFSTLPLTRLSLHNPKPAALAHLSDDDDTPYHPINLLTASSLTFLSITWTAPLAALYEHANWPLPALKELEVIMPTLTRDLVDSMVRFVRACPVGLRISISIQHHNLSEQQMGAIQIPLAGVWRYEGPLNLQVESFCSSVGSSAPSSSASASASAPAATLTTVIMSASLGLTTILSALEKLPRSLKTLNLRMHDWDIELLFAICHLFPGIQELVVRYRWGELPVDFFITLGSNILYNLPNLHTLKLITNDARDVDRAYSYAQANGNNTNVNANANALFGWGGGNVTNTNGGGNVNNNPHPFIPAPPAQLQLFFPHLLPTQPALPAFPFTASSSDEDSDDDNFPTSFASSSSSPFPSTSSNLNQKQEQEKKTKLEHGDLKDYLVGWNRYCKSLRRVQLDRHVCWVRKWEGNAWVIVVDGDGVE